ncbi:hypothetical protein CROQUDRAFT_683816 [Cronartium quercuum f. sp. fusiforme G11]|uniref:NAD(P)-binding domain-containing protein n=1 Tax=Cronartium quercuum f. sp. fusiforme G11 TaxID=708437 RepID=A0A9P6NPR4_9BASI|nr:hypothetical protein CROQUDRAFT_683816 [Cronartium quercuum f. sp. fusiforme G11]
MSGQLKCLILGATGQTGRHLLTSLLADSSISQVTEAGRRSAIESGIIALGTTRKNAGSAERFEAIDRGFPILFAKLARTSGKFQTLVYLSSAGASPNSPFLYLKSKGLTELELSSLGYDQTIIFRPGALANSTRSETRIAESITLKFTGLASYVTDSVQIPVSTLGLAMSKAGILGYSGLERHGVGSKVVGKDGQIFWVVGNADAIKLAKLDA